MWEQSHFNGYSVPWRVAKHYGEPSNEDVQDGDILMATFWPTVYWGNSLSAAKGKRVYLVQGDEGRVFSHRSQADASYRFPYLQVCVSKWVAEEVRKRHPEARQVIIQNAVDTHAFQSPVNSASREFRVGFMYSGKSFKGADIAISALKLARLRVPSLQAEVFGTDVPRGLPHWFNSSVRPVQSELPRIYSRCRVWLFPSRFEGFGLPILEAMACGTPVIATPAGAAPELVRDGGGILVPHDDPQAMADAIVRVCEMSANEWKCMSTNAINLASSYTWDDAADHLEAVLLSEVEDPPCLKFKASESRE